MDGTTVPSEVDAPSWKSLRVSFGTQSTELCEALASVAEQFCTENVDPKGILSFIACRLIVLDKYPGIGHIGSGEPVQHIVGKTISITL